MRFTVGENHFQKYPFQFGEFDWEGLILLAENPRNLSSFDGDSSQLKKTLWWFIPSSCKSKRKNDMEVHGDYSLLVADLDEGNLQLEVITNLLEFVGIHRYCIYSTSSSAPSDKRWRVVIQLAKSVGVYMWRGLQARLSFILGDADDCALRSQQLSYLPTISKANADCYEFAIGTGEPLDPVHSDFSFAAEYDRKIAERREELKEEARDKVRKERRLAVQSSEEVQIDKWKLFNEVHSLAEMMIAYGYKRKAGKWLSPNSKSGVAGAFIRVRDDGTEVFVTNHTSDQVHNKQLDAFDFYVVAYVLGMDLATGRGPAMNEWASRYELPNGMTVDEQNKMIFAKARDKDVFGGVRVSLPEECFNKGTVHDDR